MRKLQALLKLIMLRRTKQSKINGQPIITLPPKTEFEDHVVFGEDEEEYYRTLEQDSQVKVSRFLKEGLVGKRYTIALVLLLRLRQACCHPYLHMNDLEFVDYDIPMDKMLQNARELEYDAVKRIKETESFECPICFDPATNPNILLCGHSTCPQCFVQIRRTAAEKNLQDGREDAGSTCPECRGEIDLDQYITYDAFRQVHMEDEWKAEQANEYQSDDGFSSDDDETSSDYSDDDDEVDEKGNLKDFIDDDEDEVDGGVQTNDKARHSKKHKKSNQKQKAEVIRPDDLAKLRKEAGQGSGRAHERYMRYLRRIWLDSAKVTKCKDLIREIQATGEKVIVFSQWTLLLDLLELQVSKEMKIGYRRFDGSMNSIQRDRAVTDFTDDSRVKVMLISLKAGNAGLNLTAASHVIIMDPFWNPFTEYQAVDRAHRIGQLRDVKVHRILVENTVEDRIIDLQKRKRELVNAALDENASLNISKLGQNELAYLFGLPLN